MVIEGKTKYKKAIILTPERIDELFALLKKHYDSIRFEAKTFDKRTIFFDSKDELIQYENFQKGRIKELKIVCYDNRNKNLYIYFKYSNRIFDVIGYWSTVQCDYELSSLKEETLLKNELHTFFEKCKASYWLVGKFSAWGLSLVFSITMTIISSFHKTSTTETGKIVINSFIPILVVILILSLPVLFDYFVMGKLFYPVVYKWGEEGERQEKIDRLKSNFFWGIIIALIVGIATTIITNQIFK